MSDKTLVERLLESATADCTRFARVFGVECDDQRNCLDCECAVRRAIADAIEREYLPRPRFEDGELVREGDTICIDGMLPLKVHWYSVRSDGLTVFSIPTSNRKIKTGERVKRPEPEVLDADGVPIHKGDTVWYEGERYRVTDAYMLDGEDPGVDLESFSTVMGEPTKTITNAWNKLVTHKQPDSLERIEEDATMPPRNYVADRRHDVGIMDDEECAVWMCRDLLRRQRDVLERNHER